MDSMFEDDISILTQEALGPDDDWLDSPNTDLSGEMCSASHFALITAYDDIKNRLTGLERENSTLKRRLKMYEVKYPLIGEFGEEHIFSLYEAKETSLLKSEKASLQQQLNQFQHELQKSKEREEQLEEMIQAYEKLCVEKADLETELGEMVGAVRAPGGDTGVPLPRSATAAKDAPGPGVVPVPHPIFPCPIQRHALLTRGGATPTVPPSSELATCRRGLEAELEAARQETQRAQHREEHLKAECERLQAELKHLQDTREQDQSERDMAWVKKVGDDHEPTRCHAVPCCAMPCHAVPCRGTPAWLHRAAPGACPGCSEEPLVAPTPSPAPCQTLPDRRGAGAPSPSSGPRASSWPPPRCSRELRGLHWGTPRYRVGLGEGLSTSDLGGVWAKTPLNLGRADEGWGQGLLPVSGPRNPPRGQPWYRGVQSSRP
uniref:TBK1 binding protein 1 n=1 Tax=Strix occidentalis caurina TaxID=311401 RepID=A0A8D0F299_STROC